MQMSARRLRDPKRGDKWCHSFTNRCCFSMRSSASRYLQPSAPHMSHTDRVYIIHQIHIQHHLHAFATNFGCESVRLLQVSVASLQHLRKGDRVSVVYKCLSFRSRKTCVLNSFRWIDHFSVGWGEVLRKGSELEEINGKKCPYRREENKGRDEKGKRTCRLKWKAKINNEVDPEK